MGGWVAGRAQLPAAGGRLRPAPVSQPTEGGRLVAGSGLNFVSLRRFPQGTPDLNVVDAPWAYDVLLCALISTP